MMFTNDAVSRAAHLGVLSKGEQKMLRIQKDANHWHRADHDDNVGPLDDQADLEGLWRAGNVVSRQCCQ